MNNILSIYTAGHRTGGDVGFLRRSNYLKGAARDGDEETGKGQGRKSEAEEVRKVGEEFEGCRCEGEEERREEFEHGRLLCQEDWFEEDQGCRAGSSEGVHEDWRAVFCEGGEHAADQEQDIPATAGFVLCEQGEVSRAEDGCGMDEVYRESGDVQWADERGEFPQDGECEEDNRRGRGNVFAGLDEEPQNGRFEEGGEVAVYYGDWAGRSREVAAGVESEMCDGAEGFRWGGGLSPLSLGERRAA